MNDRAWAEISDERFDILIEIADERIRQDKQWGGPEHDDQHTFWEWISIINNLGAKAVATGAFRSGLIEIAAVSAAAIEAIDRAERARNQAEQG